MESALLYYNYMVIAVDFDGTIVRHEYPKIGREIPFAIDTLKRLQHEFQHQIVLWTVREGKELDEAVDYCRARGLEFYAVNANHPDEVPEPGISRKVNADLFIDDHNLGGLPDWGIIYRMIADGRCFEPPADTFGKEATSRKKGFFKRF